MAHESEEGETIVRQVKTHWFYEDFLRHKLKYLLGGIGIVLLLWGLWSIFDWWLLFFFPIVPLWAVLLYRFLTHDYIRVLEVQLPGDARKAPSGEYKTISFADSSTLWYFPPERFREYEKKGTAIKLPGSDIFVVDKVDDEEQVLYFPEPPLANLDYYTSAQAFLYLKKQLTALMRQNILLKNFMSSYAYTIAAKLLERFKIIDNVAEKANAPELMEPDEFEEMINKMLRTPAADKKKNPEEAVIDD